MKFWKRRPVAVGALEHDAAALEQALQHELDLEPALLVCSTPSARFSKSTNTAVVSSVRNEVSVIEFPVWNE